MSEVTRARPLQGLELDLFYELEAWEYTIPADRAVIVSNLRQIAEKIVDV